MAQLPLITSVFMNVTDSCNMACRYCFCNSNPRTMAFQTAKDTADFLVRNAKVQGGTPSINFFGGEPTLCWDSIIVPLTNYIREELSIPFTLSMTSNCTLLNDKRIEFMKTNQIGLLFSIDGGRETQEYNRPLRNGESSFDAVKAIIPTLVDTFHGLTFRSTAIPATCHNLFSDMMFAVKSGFFNYFVVPNVFEEWDESARATLQSEMRKFSDYNIDCYRNGRHPIWFNTFDKSFKQIGLINQSHCDGAHRAYLSCQSCGKCGLGGTISAAVDVDGNLFGCQELSSYTNLSSPFYIGDIYNGVDIGRRTALMGLFDSHKVAGGECNSCLLSSVCDGGCVANNYLISGDVNCVPEMYCFWMRLLLNEAIYVMNVLGKEENRLFRAYWQGVL